MTPPDQGYTWVDRPIARSPMSVGYRIGLAVVSVMMVLLPAVYVLVCAAIPVGLYFYVMNFGFLLEYKQAGIVAVFGPLIAGIICVFFMVKPLFTRRKRITAHMSVTREEQPQLFQFIDEVCTRIGAPKPVRVRFDNQVNASASFEHGWWGVLTRRLVLTIGLPLAQGLTVSQFGGVLAHEFGHFTQSAAMRFNYVIRTVNGWFSRVIFERDSFDEGLVKWSRRGNIYTILIARLAQGCVWLARKILWLLMRAGHAVSAYLMRQMEYDADHYEMEVTGAANFRETFVLMRLMNAGTQMAVNHLDGLWKDGKLVDNVPELTRRLLAELPGTALQQLRDNLDAEKSAAPWHSTHPSDPERIARTAGREPMGVLLGDQPATALFTQFDETAKKLTLIDYKERHNLKVKPEALVATGAYLDKIAARGDQLKSLGTFFGGVLHEHRLIFPDAPAEAASTSLDDVRARYHACAEALEQAQPATEKLRTELEAARTKRAQAYAARMFSGMGIAIQPQNFSLENVLPATIDQTISDNSAKIEELYRELDPALQLATEKLFCLCRIPECPEWLVRTQDHADWVAWNERIAALKHALLAIRPIDASLNKARKPFFMASLCLENFQKARDKKWTEREFNAHAAELQAANREIEAVANVIPYPLNDGKSYAHLAGYFITGHSQPGPVGQFHLIRSTFERFSQLYADIVLELLEKATAVEQACAPATPESARQD